MNNNYNNNWKINGGIIVVIPSIYIYNIYHYYSVCTSDTVPLSFSTSILFNPNLNRCGFFACLLAAVEWSIIIMSIIFPILIHYTYDATPVIVLREIWIALLFWLTLFYIGFWPDSSPTIKYTRGRSRGKWNIAKL